MKVTGKYVCTKLERDKVEVIIDAIKLIPNYNNNTALCKTLNVLDKFKHDRTYYDRVRNGEMDSPILIVKYGYPANALATLLIWTRTEIEWLEWIDVITQLEDRYYEGNIH